MGTIYDYLVSRYRMRKRAYLCSGQLYLFAHSHWSLDHLVKHLQDDRARQLYALRQLRKSLAKFDCFKLEDLNV